MKRTSRKIWVIGFFVLLWGCTSSNQSTTQTSQRPNIHPIYHLLKIYNEKGLLTPAQKTLVLPMPAEELYDLEPDPYEVYNLANDVEHVEQLVALRKKLQNWQTRVKDYGMEEDSEALKEAFIQYGIKSKNTYQAKIEAMEGIVAEAIE